MLSCELGSRHQRAVEDNGKQAQDAHLVAAMLVHKVTHLLTFNDGDFRRFTEITVVNPQHIISPSGSEHSD